MISQGKGLNFSRLLTLQQLKRRSTCPILLPYLVICEAAIQNPARHLMEGTLQHKCSSQLPDSGAAIVFGELLAELLNRLPNGKSLRIPLKTRIMYSFVALLEGIHRAHHVPDKVISVP